MKKRKPDLVTENIWHGFTLPKWLFWLKSSTTHLIQWITSEEKNIPKNAYQLYWKCNMSKYFKKRYHNYWYIPPLQSFWWRSHFLTPTICHFSKHFWGFYVILKNVLNLLNAGKISFSQTESDLWKSFRAKAGK